MLSGIIGVIANDAAITAIETTQTKSAVINFDFRLLELLYVVKVFIHNTSNIVIKENMLI